MARRLIGQERFGFAGRARPGSSLDELATLIDWQPVAALLDPMYSAAKGEPAWPPLAMFKALLLSIWYDLSDVKLAEALEVLSDKREPLSTGCTSGLKSHGLSLRETATPPLRRSVVPCRLRD